MKPCVLQRGYFCEKFGKSSDILADSLQDLVYEAVDHNAERLDAIIKYENVYMYIQLVHEHILKQKQYC